MDFLLGLLILLFLSQAILGPIVVRFRVSANKQLRIVSSDLSGIPQSFADKIRGYCNELEALGFGTPGFFEAPDFMPNVHAAIALLLNSRHRTRAMVAAIMDFRRLRLRTCYVEFMTEFSDETELCTNNSSELPAFIEIPGKKMFQFPMIDDMKRLYKAHGYLRGIHFGNRTVVLNGEEDEISFLASSILKEFVQQEQLGYYYLDSSGTKYRPTWKGAVMMTWRLMWPIGAVRKMLRYTRARSILREVDIAM